MPVVLLDEAESTLQSPKVRFPLLRAFSSGNFRLFFTGTFLSYIGTWIHMMTLDWVAYEVTGSKAFVGLITTYTLIPTLLLGPFSGVLSDLFCKRRVFQYCQLALIVNALYLGYVCSLPEINPIHFSISTLFVGLIIVIEMPAHISIVSSCVPKNNIAPAIPLNELAFYGGRLIGPAIGGVLLVTQGPSICFYINALSYCALFVAASRIRLPEKPLQRSRHCKSLSFWFEGIRYVFKNRALLLSIGMMGASVGFGTIYGFLMPAIAKELLHVDKLGYASCYMFQGIGAIGGLLLLTSLSDSKNRHRYLVWPMMILSIALLCLSVNESLQIAFILVALVKACYMIQLSVTRTLCQILPSEELRGRVLSIEVWLTWGLGAITYPFFGWIAQTYSLPLALQLAGALIAFILLLALRQKNELKQVNLER